MEEDGSPVKNLQHELSELRLLRVCSYTAHLSNLRQAQSSLGQMRLFYF